MCISLLFPREFSSLYLNLLSSLWVSLYDGEPLGQIEKEGWAKFQIMQKKSKEKCPGSMLTLNMMLQHYLKCVIVVREGDQKLL